MKYSYLDLIVLIIIINSFHFISFHDNIMIKVDLVVDSSLCFTDFAIVFFSVWKPLFLFLSVSLFLAICLYLFIYLFLSLSHYFYHCLSHYISIYLFIYLSIYYISLSLKYTLLISFFSLCTSLHFSFLYKLIPCKASSLKKKSGPPSFDEDDQEGFRHG